MSISPLPDPQLQKATRFARRGEHACEEGEWVPRCFSPDEIHFIDAAFNCILPGDGLARGGACQLDRKLREATVTPTIRQPDVAYRTPVPEPSSMAFYKMAIAAVQRHCLRTHGDRFQLLPPCTQLQVLAQLEEGPASRPGGELRILVAMLVRDAAEAYFDLVATRHEAAAVTEAV